MVVRVWGAMKCLSMLVHVGACVSERSSPRTQTSASIRSVVGVAVVRMRASLSGLARVRVRTCE